MYLNNDQDLHSQIVGLPPGASSLTSGGIINGGTINGGMLSSGSISVDAPIQAYNPKIAVQDDTELVLDDGSSYTGKDLKVMLKLLKKLALEEYPEEFV